MRLLFRKHTSPNRVAGLMPALIVLIGAGFMLEWSEASGSRDGGWVSGQPIERIDQ